MTKKPSYDCEACGAACCCIYDEVEVSDEDIEKIAKHLECTTQEVRTKYTKRSKDSRILQQRKDTQFNQRCVFLDKTTRKCTIYKARPEVCREYPYTDNCGYYDFLIHERKRMCNDNMLVQVTFCVKES